MPIIYGNVGGREHRNLQPLAGEPRGRMKRCQGCGLLLPVDRFNVYKDGRLSAKCDMCRKRAVQRRKTRFRKA